MKDEILSTRCEIMNEINDFEDSEKSFKTNTYRSQLHEWERLNVGPSRALVYLSIFLAVFVFGGLFLWGMNFLNSDQESGRYLLSSLVQCQAAIISIVVSLTLIAVQLTTQKYSFKMIEIFKKDPDLWILLLVYIISIAYELLILKEIDTTNKITANLGYYVSIAYLLGLFTFLALIPYILNIINLLRSDTLVLRLISRISEESFPKSRAYSDYNPNDPLQPIFDVIHASVKQYDISTLDFALKHLLIKISSILKRDPTIRTSDTISDYFCENLKRTGLLAIDKGDTEVIGIIIDTLEAFGRIETTTKLNGSNTIFAIISLKELGSYSSEKNIEYPTHWIVNSISRLGGCGAERKIRNVTSCAINALEEIDRIIINNSNSFPRSDEIQEKIVIEVSRIGDEIVRNANPKIKSDETYAICDPIGALYSMGLQRLNNKKYNEIPEIIGNIADIGFITAQKCNEEDVFERSLREAVESLDKLGRSAIYNKLYPSLHASLKGLDELLEISINKQLNFTALNSFKSLYNLCRQIEEGEDLQYSKTQILKILLRLAMFIRLMPTESESWYFNDRIIKHLQKFNKKDSSFFMKTFEDYRQDLSKTNSGGNEKLILENLLVEIEGN